MNWLTEVSRQVRACGADRVRADQLVLSVITLSNICDRHVPHAPAPQVEYITDGEEKGSIDVSWYWQERQRSLSVIVDAEGKTSLTMLDDGRAIDVAPPSYDELRTAVTSFFDGWVPRG